MRFTIHYPLLERKYKVNPKVWPKNLNIGTIRQTYLTNMVRHLKQHIEEIKILALTTVSILIHITSLSQPTAQVENYFASIRAGKNPPSLAVLTNGKNENKVLTRVLPYTQDTLTQIRYSAYSLIATLGQKSTSTPNCQKAVNTLITGWRDKDSGINGLVGLSLQQFRQTDFANTSKDSLRSLIKVIPPHYDKLLKLCGSLQMTDQQTVIQFQLQSGAIKNKRDRWTAQLALCRMGDQNATNYIMSRVKKIGINDDVVYEVFPDLIYTRNKEAIAYVIESLYSDEKNCESANPEASENIPCGYRVMELLAPIIKAYPFKLSASGDLEVNDYKAALVKTRQWFKDHPNYEIIND